MKSQDPQLDQRPATHSIDFGYDIQHDFPITKFECLVYARVTNEGIIKSLELVNQDDGTFIPFESLNFYDQKGIMDKLTKELDNV